MPKTLQQIVQSAFPGESKREEFLRGQVFLQPNDKVGLWDVPPDTRLRLAVCDDGQQLINIFVGNGDYASIAGDVAGDILLVDINEALLSYLRFEQQLLLSIYQRYLHEDGFGFKEVQKAILKALQIYDLEAGHVKRSAEIALYTRRELLGPRHFLYSEARYRHCMAGLSAKQFACANVDLFKSKERGTLANTLVGAGYEVNLFNFTNLPDYDSKTHSIELVEALPFREGALVLWNFHDRGPRGVSGRPSHLGLYEHALFYVSPSEFRKLMQEKFPQIIREYDFIRFKGDSSGSLQRRLPNVARRVYLIAHVESDEEMSVQAVFKKHGVPFVEDRVEDMLTTIMPEFTKRKILLTEAEFDALRFNKQLTRLVCQACQFNGYTKEEISVLIRFFIEIDEKTANRYVRTLQALSYNTVSEVISVLRQLREKEADESSKEQYRLTLDNLYKKAATHHMKADSTIPVAFFNTGLDNPEFFDALNRLLDKVKRRTDYTVVILALRHYKDVIDFIHYAEVALRHSTLLSPLVSQVVEAELAAPIASLLQKDSIIGWLVYMETTGILTSTEHLISFLKAYPSIGQLNQIFTFLDIQNRVKLFPVFHIDHLLRLSKRPQLLEFFVLNQARRDEFFKRVMPVLRELDTDAASEEKLKAINEKLKSKQLREREVIQLVQDKKDTAEKKRGFRP